MKRSLGALLAVGLAGLQFLAVLAVVFSSYVTSEQALLSHARDLLRDVGANTIAHCRGFLSPAQSAAELASRLAQNRVIASEDPAALEQLLFEQLKIAPQFAGLYYGAEDGSFVYVMRSPDGPAAFRTKIITHDGGQRRTQLLWRDGDFAVAERREDPTDEYDPRRRPWYVEARARLATVWTDPYSFFSSQKPGITLGAPVMAEGGGIRGVVGVDIEISKISDFLLQLNIGPHGRALIVNHNGDVIAHPNEDLIKTRSADGTLRFANIAELDDPIARAAFAAMARDGAAAPGQAAGQGAPTSEFQHDGAAYLSILMPPISHTLPWTIAVYALEDDFIGDLKHNRTLNIVLAALVSALTAMVGLGLAEYIHRPVRAFAVRNALISQGEIDPQAPMPQTYRELAQANDALVQQIVARRETEHQYGQTFEMASCALAQTEPGSGRLLLVSQRFCDLTGHDRETLLGMTIGDLAHPLDRDAVTPDPGPHQELRWIRRDGQEIRVALSGILIRDGRGKPLHSVVTVEDISRSKDVERQIDRLKSDLSHLARGSTMGQMAAGLAHELNQPLTAIAQNADAAVLVLDQGRHPDAELRQILTAIEDQSLRAGEIIRALRSFIKKDEGERTVFDLGALLAQTLQLMQAEANEAGVTIRTVLDPDLPPVEGNRVQIAQVIVNLLRNAIEAMAAQPGGEVVVRIQAAPEALTVSIRDHGRGIQPGIQLFTQFETSKPGGMGLGLSICQSIVESHGGRIWHQADVAPGALFQFTLPPAMAA